jgi:hypothetical protein
MVAPKVRDIIARHLSAKTGSIVIPVLAGWSWNQVQKAAAKARFIEGGYSFSGAVRHTPSAVLPMALRFGSSDVTWCSLKRARSNGILRASNLVGLGE